MINGTYSFNDGDNTLSPVSADQLDSIPSFTLSNGAKLIHGTLIIDSTQPNALHLVESNEHERDNNLVGNTPIGLGTTTAQQPVVTFKNNNVFGYTGGTIVNNSSPILTGNGSLSDAAGTSVVVLTPTSGIYTGGMLINNGEIVSIGSGTSIQH